VLFVTLHGDRTSGETSAPGNALSRFRLTSSDAGDSAPLQLQLLPPVVLSPVTGVDAAGTALMMPRGMALAGDSGDTLLVASAAADSVDNPKGAIMALSARDAACVSQVRIQQAPPSGKDAKKRKGPDAAVASVPAKVVWSAGARHPYGVAASPVSSTLAAVSNQGNGRTVAIDINAGTTVFEYPRHCVGAPAAKQNSSGTTGLRGVAVSRDGRRLYVACKDENAVYMHDVATGTLIGALEVALPIALLAGDIDEATPGVFVGTDSSAGSDKEVVVHFFADSDPQGAPSRVRYSVIDGGGHAAGLARVGGALLVLGQDAGALHQFHAASGAYVATLVKGLKRPEAVQPWTGDCGATA
jgi:hypothetical protein